MTPTGQRKTAQAIDRTLPTQLTKPTVRLPPVSLSLADADSAIHLAALPSYRLYLAQHAIELTRKRYAA